MKPETKQFFKYHNKIWRYFIKSEKIYAEINEIFKVNLTSFKCDCYIIIKNNACRRNYETFSSGIQFRNIIV